MSERIPTAPTPATTEQQPATDRPGQPPTSGESRDTAETSSQAPERTTDTPNEAAARDTLNQIGQLEEEAGHQAGWRIRAMNRKDRIQSAATLQTARQLRLEGRAARLERKLVTAKPHSRKAMRLETALNLANYRANKISNARNKTFGRMHERSKGYSGELKKVASVERKRHEQIIKVKVAIEKKRRRKIAKKYALEMRSPDPGLRQHVRQELSSGNRHREQLRKEIASWRGNGIRKFEASLLADVEQKYINRIKQGNI